MEILFLLAAVVCVLVVVYLANQTVHDTFDRWWSKIRRGEKLGGPE